MAGYSGNNRGGATNSGASGGAKKTYGGSGGARGGYSGGGKPAGAAAGGGKKYYAVQFHPDAPEDEQNIFIGNGFTFKKKDGTLMPDKIRMCITLDDKLDIQKNDEGQDVLWFTLGERKPKPE